MKSIVRFAFSSLGSGGSCAAIVYFLERTNSQPMLTEDIAAFVVAAVGAVCLALSGGFE